MDDLLYRFLYIVTFILLIYLFLTTRKKRAFPVLSNHSESSWWPWKITVYNWWPEWLGSSRKHVVIPPPASSVSHERPWGGASRHANVSAPRPSS